jgi:spore germination protein YaaH
VLKNCYLSICGLLIGLSLGYYYHYFINENKTIKQNSILTVNKPLKKSKQVVGFLPYWLINNAKDDYSSSINTLTYFGLTIDTDGSILKYTSPGEGEPGWVTLNNGKVDEMINTAKDKNINLSLLVFSAKDEKIQELISQPEENADKLTKETFPIMKKYGFSDLNIDIENISEASDEARLNFTRFIRKVKNNLSENGIPSLTVEITGSDVIKKKLIDVEELAKIADHIVIMAYDYHHPGSMVTGPVSPLYGMSTVAEYDVDTTIKEALRIIPKEKIILGIPLYGYEWETLSDNPRASVISGTSATVSNKKAENILKDCLNCKLNKDEEALESYIIYPDSNGVTYHQIFYPDKTDTSAKLEITEQNNLEGIALWALGYEGDTILEPLSDYLTKN